MRTRAHSLSNETKRKAYRARNTDITKFLMNSHIRVTIAEADVTTYPRITQLFNKTNQFNLTTKRFSQSKLESFAGKENTHLFYMDMKDIYGDYGIIACALLIENTIDSFVLSCRAFGKHAENAFLLHILTYLKNTSYLQVNGWYLATKKNSMTRDFYKSAGFTLKQTDGENTEWQFDLTGEIKAYPPWISVRSKIL